MVSNKLPRFYLITSRKQTRGRPLVNVVEAALDGGARMIQLREKDLPDSELFELAKELVKLTEIYKAKLLINGRPDIALSANADGVHLPADSFPPQEARKLLGEEKLIGVSTHSPGEAIKAERGGADFITFSPIYHTPSKKPYGEPQGVKRLREICESIKIPVYALGGIKIDNIKEVKEAGAFGVALISAISEAGDVKAASSRILSMVSGD